MLVRYSRRGKRHDRIEGTGKSFILCSSRLSTNTSVDGWKVVLLFPTVGVLFCRSVLLCEAIEWWTSSILASPAIYCHPLSTTVYIPKCNVANYVH